VPKRRGAHPAAVLAVLIGMVLLVGVAVWGVVSCTRSSDSARPAEGTQVEVVIPQGAGGDTIVQALLDAGVIANAKEYYAAAAELDADGKLQPGTYEFVIGQTPLEVVQQLIDGPNTTRGKLTVPEGLTVAQTAEVVQTALGISTSDFMAEAKASNFVSAFSFLNDVGDDSLEGFLAGKTYDFSGQDVSAHTVIEAMLAQYEQEVAPLDMSAQVAALNARYNLTLTSYDIIKLASIIEREAVTDDDRGKVASVFCNRLAIDMALQSDATMSYVTGGDVTASDLTTQSPYNSYLNKGLPPTPICSPSLASIKAALNPDDTPYYYFFIVENGSYSNHSFSETYEEHQAVIAQALKDQGAS
jgi:UPF0755 protein